MSFLKSLDIAASGLTAQRMRMDVIAQNVANINITRGPDGQPYQRKFVVMQSRENDNFQSALSTAINSRSGAGVSVTEIATDTSPFKLQHNPNHPDADANGYVRMPNVEYITEMVDMMNATRTYEANITALNAFKSMASRALQIGANNN